jgi:hypothetical protein
MAVKMVVKEDHAGWWQRGKREKWRRESKCGKECINCFNGVKRERDVMFFFIFFSPVQKPN